MADSKKTIPKADSREAVEERKPPARSRHDKNSLADLIDISESDLDIIGEELAKLDFGGLDIDFDFNI